MTHQILSLKKCWKLLGATLSYLFQLPNTLLEVFKNLTQLKVYMTVIFLFA